MQVKQHGHGVEQLQKKRAVTEAAGGESSTAAAPRQSTLQEAFHKGRVYPDDSPRARTITRLIGEMICKDLQPISVVEDSGSIIRVKLCIFNSSGSNSSGSNSCGSNSCGPTTYIKLYHIISKRNMGRF
uniref:Uncharacterized protein n=1 Tax=Knipowitschia caucasica TaxID=637954 RepID=A0AAV2MFB4_KNICA